MTRNDWAPARVPIMMALLLGAACSMDDVGDEDVSYEEPGRDSLAVSTKLGDAVPLNIVSRVRIGNDRMSTTNASERDAFPLEGAILYVPSGGGPGTQPYYRLFNGADHMDSGLAGEGGYTTEGILGHPYTSPTAVGRGHYFLYQILRATSLATGDHATLRAGESLPGYVNESPPLYGWGRPNNDEAQMLSLSAGGVTIESNAVAGGALFHWFWNGVQFVNNADYGRQLQGTIAFLDSRENPTEAGDAWGHWSRRPAARHGSPTIAIANSGTTQTTRAVPLEWEPTVFEGGGPDNPVIYPDLVIGKDVTLNFQERGPVAQYTTVIDLPKAVDNAMVTVPASYLRANFAAIWTYDLQSGALEPVCLPPPCSFTNVEYDMRPDFVANMKRCGGVRQEVHSPYGAVIAADTSTVPWTVIGYYGVHPSAGGSVSEFTMWDFRCAGDGAGEFALDTVKIDAVSGPRSLPAGESRFNSYVVTGTFDNVLQQMRALYRDGVR